MAVLCTHELYIELLDSDVRKEQSRPFSKDRRDSEVGLRANASLDLLRYRSTLPQTVSWLVVLVVVGSC